LFEFVTDAENCCDAPRFTVALAGETETLTTGGGGGGGGFFEEPPPPTAQPVITRRDAMSRAWTTEASGEFARVRVQIRDAGKALRCRRGELRFANIMQCGKQRACHSGTCAQKVIFRASAMNRARGLTRRMGGAYTAGTGKKITRSERRELRGEKSRRTNSVSIWNSITGRTSQIGIRCRVRSQDTRFAIRPTQ
jgi:hypothetical protein